MWLDSTTSIKPPLSLPLASKQLPVIQQFNPIHSHPDVEETHVPTLMDNKSYTMVPSDGMESLTAGTHSPQTIWEMHQSSKAAMSDHKHLDADMASMHHLHSKPCFIKEDPACDATITYPGVTRQARSSSHIQHVMQVFS